MLYEYMCKNKHVTEVYTSDYNLKEVECKVCSAHAKKILSAGYLKGLEHDALVNKLRKQYG